MLKSIQWKLVIISFLLVWLAMAIVGVFASQNIKKIQMDSMEEMILTRARDFANNLGSKIGGAVNIKEIGDNFYMGQGQHVKAMRIYHFSQQDPIYENANFYTTEKSSINVMLESILDGEREPIVTSDPNEYYKHIMIPIFESNGGVSGALYLGVDFSYVQDSINEVQSMFTNATVMALSITVLLGIILARTITGPIKEVTSKAEQLAKGEYGQVISVKSNDEVGQLTEMFNYMSSRLKDTLEEVYNEKTKVDTIVTHMTDGIIAVDVDGNIIHANPAVYSLFNIDRHELESKRFDDFSKDYGLGMNCYELFNDSEKNHNILSINNSIIRVNVEPFKNEKNEINGVIVVLQDVTEQEKLDKMRKEFVANVSHELRTPLTTIKSYTETLLDGALENKEYTVNFLKVINSESDRMTRLVKDLLQLSKLDYDNVQWNMKKINLSAILKECIYKMDISAKQKNQQLNYEAETEYMEIVGDKDRIEQVIINIISNAIKYTPDNGSIEVKAAREQDYAVIKVIDNGIGIPKEDIPRLFERFYRVDKARSRAMGGTGLGLSIAKQIVEAHKGYIKIDSEYGKGTQVTIGLPASGLMEAS
ncbi:MAG: two-component system histidine kinase PnpS [Bacillota bacterium]